MTAGRSLTRCCDLLRNHLLLKESALHNLILEPYFGGRFKLPNITHRNELDKSATS